jgi:predicted methyltransferase
LQVRYEDRLALVGISLDEEVGKVDRMVAQKGMRWPQIAQGANGELVKLYHVEGTPTLYLVDRQGTIAALTSSAKEIEQHLTEIFADYPRPPRVERDSWQRPAKVLEELGARSGSVVADIGSGEGYFTFHLAARAGSEGKVYAVDIDEKALGKIRERAGQEKLVQIVSVHGAEDDPRLPAGALDGALIVDSYHEFVQQAKMLAAIQRALKPGGKLAILERTDRLGLPRGEYAERHKLPPETLIEEAGRAGLRLLTYLPDFAGPPHEPKYYLAVFQKAP